MTRDAATVAVVVALALGFYVAKWFQAENDEDAARARAAAATRAAWRARKVIAIAGFVAFAAIHTWLRDHGG